MSYSELEKIGAVLRLQKLELADENIVLPNAHPHAFTTLAWDNMDRFEAIPSGEGTSHRLNGIAIQLKVEGPLPQSALLTVTKLKRSISPTHLNFLLTMLDHQD